LVGSFVGVAAGTSIGLLLWKGAAEAGFGEERFGHRRREGPDAATVLFGAGILAFVAGGPVGAVEGSRIEERRAGAYVSAGVGEFVLGGLAYGLVSRMHGGLTPRLLGLGVGAAIGAAGGTTLVASEAGRGAVTYRNGTWRASLPTIRVQPLTVKSGSSSVNVTFLSMRW